MVVVVVVVAVVVAAVVDRNRENAAATDDDVMTVETVDDDAEVRTEPVEAAVEAEVPDSRCMTADVESVLHKVWTGIFHKTDDAVAVDDDVEIDETDSEMTCKDAVVGDEISIRCQEDQQRKWVTG